jgi:hypothetical protein
MNDETVWPPVTSRLLQDERLPRPPQARRSALPRFGLRSAFVFAVAFCLLFGWIADLYHSRQQQAALDALAGVDAKITLYESDGGWSGHPRAFPVLDDSVWRFFRREDELRVRSVFIWSGRNPSPGSVPRAIAVLPTFDQLEWVSLSGPEVTDDSMLDLQRLPHLKSVWLDRTQVTRVGLERLGPLPNLEEVRLFESKDFSRGLAKLTQLRTLVISDSPLTRADVEAIASLPNLQHLSFTGVTPIHLNTYAPLETAVGLTSLRISDGRSHDADMKVIGTLENLETLSVTGVRDAALADLAALKKLRRVEFDVYVSGQAAMRFSEERPGCMVRHNGHVRGRYYRDGRIVDESELTPSEANVWAIPRGL